MAEQLNRTAVTPRGNGVTEEASSLLPTRFGAMKVRVYTNDQGAESMAIISGALDVDSAVPIRVHSACLTAEVLGSMKCDCKSQLDYALQYIADNGGLVIYLPQEGRGVGLVNKIKAYALQEQGLDTVDANRALGLPDDAREYHDAANILKQLGIRKIRLLTNNPLKVTELKALGVEVSERIPMPLMANKHSLAYLSTKRQRMGHLIELGDVADEYSLHPIDVNRPVVHVNFALDESGRTAQESGEPLSLSCDEDWRRVHELREHYSAVVVGARTWILDKPCLTARSDYLGRNPRRQPERVIFAGRKHCEFQADERRTFVIGSGPATQGAICIESMDHGLSQPLKALRAHGISSMLVEGGLTLLRSFIRERSVDQITIYVRTESHQSAAEAIRAALPGFSLQNLQFERFGEGILASGEHLFPA